jgi:hypothetical protein
MNNLRPLWVLLVIAWLVIAVAWGMVVMSWIIR